MVTNIYIAQTERGTGITLPISKANAHIMSIWTAIERKWPMTLDEAIVEIEEAKAHLMDLTRIPDTLMSEEARTRWDLHVANVTDKLLDLSNRIDGVNTHETELPETAKDPIERLIEESWQLLCVFDREIGGLRSDQCDPGMRP